MPTPKPIPTPLEPPPAPILPPTPVDEQAANTKMPTHNKSFFIFCCPKRKRESMIDPMYSNLFNGLNLILKGKL